jgi:chromate transporter
MDWPLLQLALLFGRLSLIGFGGNDAILAEMQRQTVEAGWMTSVKFTEAYALRRVAPGPGGLLPIMVGYQAAGLAGAVVAILSYLGPTIALAVACARYLRESRDQRWPKAIRVAVTPISVGLLVAAIYVLATLVIRDTAGAAIAVGTVLVMLTGRVPVAAVPLAAAAVGVLFL